ncbi:MAG: purine/pyrimidine permease [Syntrophobacterales bacterium]|nr:purine/pyrimidine permease [Syntrophobacterales bacterium]
MKYNVDDKPGAIPMIVYGLQWWAVSVPSIIIIGIIVAKLHFTAPGDQIFYMQKLFGIVGLTLIIQMIWGHRLPLVVGPASVLLIGVTACMASSAAAIYTAIAIGGIFVSILAFSGFLAKMQSIFSARVVVVILMLIAYTLSPVILNLIFSTHPLFHLSFALILVLAMLVGNHLLKGIWKSTIIIWALILGCLVYTVAAPSSSTFIIHKSHFSLSQLFIFPPEFDIAVILSFLFCFIALIINELGSIQAVGQLLKVDKIEKRINRGVGMAGISNTLAGTIGVIGPVDFSMSPGIIAASGCASRYPLIPAGIGLLLCAFFPPFISFLSGIPNVVLGSILLYLMASQLAAGMQMLVNEKAIYDFSTGLVVGLPLMVAIIISFAPADAINQIPALIRPILGNGFVMGIITVILMERLQAQFNR